MNPETIEFLRSATIEALQNKQDVAAVELLSLMDLGQQNKPVLLPSSVEQHSEHLQIAAHQPPQLPPLPNNSDARDFHFWERAIQDYYLPVLRQENKDQFTTAQFFSWVDYVGFPLTSGDLEKPGGHRPRWKERAGNALGKLTEEGVIFRLGYFGKTFSIVKPQSMLSPA